MFQTLILAMGLLTGSAKADSTETIGVLHKEDIHVVQRVLFPKRGRTEIGASLGLMAFDPYLTTPNVQVSYELHQREQLSIGFILGGGYGLKTGVTKTMESPAYGVSPYAFRYLASALVGVTWSPIYAKMSLAGLRVLHYDIYGTARAGATLEQSVIPDGGMP
ncbi:MAG: hypothetical protein HN348_36255, partial [Proteobacteria bacterium]|nr:hypothetical protein [Pseudomonadota bacterium]